MTSMQVDIEKDALASIHDAAWRWTLHLTNGDRTFAEDVLQTSYVLILEGKAKWKGNSSLRTWVFGVIRMTEKSMRRRRNILNFRFTNTAPETLCKLSPGTVPHTPMTRTMMQALSALPPQQAELAELVFGQDCTIKDAAAIMRISIGAARAHYARLKASLRIALAHTKEPTHD